MKNYSRDGICLLSNYPVEKGALITIKKTSFRLMSAISAEGNIDCLEIIWCNKDKTDPSYQYGIGARRTEPEIAAENEADVFVEITASAERAFADFDCQKIKTAFDSAKGVARKCNMCHQRVENGLYPACADNVCLAHCIYFRNRK